MAFSWKVKQALDHLIKKKKKKRTIKQLFKYFPEYQVAILEGNRS